MAAFPTKPLIMEMQRMPHEAKQEVSRRDFIKGTSAAVGSATATAMAISIEDKNMPLLYDIQCGHLFFTARQRKGGCA